MSSQYINDQEMKTLAYVARKLNQHIQMRAGDDLSFSGQVQAVDCNGERVGTFYSIGDIGNGWNFYPLGNTPEVREVSSDAKDALERLYEAVDRNEGVTLDQLIDILPPRDLLT